MTNNPAILDQLSLSEIDAVVFYKRDEITSDLICCDVEIQGCVWTFHEEAAGWQAVIAHLSALPGFRNDWYEAVINPPFATIETISFKRRQSPTSGHSSRMVILGKDCDPAFHNYPRNYHVDGMSSE